MHFNSLRIYLLVAQLVLGPTPACAGDPELFPRDGDEEIVSYSSTDPPDGLSTVVSTLQLTNNSAVDATTQSEPSSFSDVPLSNTAMTSNPSEYDSLSESEFSYASSPSSFVDYRLSNAAVSYSAEGELEPGCDSSDMVSCSIWSFSSDSSESEMEEWSTTLSRVQSTLINEQDGVSIIVSSGTVQVDTEDTSTAAFHREDVVTPDEAVETSPTAAASSETPYISSSVGHSSSATPTTESTTGAAEGWETPSEALMTSPASAAATSSSATPVSSSVVPTSSSPPVTETTTEGESIPRKFPLDKGVGEGYLYFRRRFNSHPENW